VLAGSGGTAVGRLEYHRAEVAGRPVRVAPRPLFLAGREELLADVGARLAGQLGEGPRVVVLCGLGGAGKTSVAVEYAHRQLGQFGLVWQVSAENPAAMSAGFGELAALLGARNLLDAQDPVAAVHAVLAARPGGWLLILDNAQDAATVRPVLPPAGKGQVLITTRSAHWPGTIAVEVPVLEQDIAAGFLAARTGDGNREAAWALAGELGGLPLALEQAAAYITATGRDLAGYLAAYRGRKMDLLDRGDPAGYDQRVTTTTWSLSFTQLQDEAPGGAALLNLLACCASDTIPYHLLLQPAVLPDGLPAGPGAVLAPLLGDPLAVVDAIATLRRYSLISPPINGLVSVHRLVQAITAARQTSPQAAAWRQATAALISAAVPTNPDLPATWPVFAGLLPHVLAALPLASEPVYRAASYLGTSGSYTTARDLLQQILTSYQDDLGAEHPDTLAVRANLASWTGEAGDAAAARDQCAILLPVRERVSGAEHPDTLAVRTDLASWTGEAGDAAAARDQCAILLPVRERVSGAEHPDTLTERTNLAHWTREAGRLRLTRWPWRWR
jgi:hypothetical protein